jgi:hypothetical protein
VPGWRKGGSWRGALALVLKEEEDAAAAAWVGKTIEGVKLARVKSLTLVPVRILACSSNVGEDSLDRDVAASTAFSRLHIRLRKSNRQMRSITPPPAAIPMIAGSGRVELAPPFVVVGGGCGCWRGARMKEPNDPLEGAIG